MDPRHTNTSLVLNPGEIMKLFRSLMTVILAAAVSVSVMSKEHGTKDEAKALTNAAIAHIKKVGNEQASKDFTTDKANWNKKDMYVYTADTKGVVFSHGANEKMVGKNMMELKDQTGKPFVRELIELATTKGEGWIEYDWTNPQTKKVEGKTSYVKRVPGADIVVIVGIYR